MKDTVYFNELCLNEVLCKLPETKKEYKDLLLQFVRSCLGYILANGFDENIAMVVSSAHLQNTIYKARLGYSPRRLISELRIEESLSEPEVNRFCMFFGHSFEQPWEPEYEYKGVQAAGMGKAESEGSYAFSLETSEKEEGYKWNASSYLLNKIPAEGNEEEINVKHISSLEHVFILHECFNGCKAINKKPTASYLPYSNRTILILNAFGYADAQGFEKIQGDLDQTKVKGVAKAVAISNGWKYIGVNERRDTYQAGNYYLQTDIQHRGFEVYKGTKEHLGELSIANGKLNENKDDGTRRLNL